MGEDRRGEGDRGEMREGGRAVSRKGGRKEGERRKGGRVGTVVPS